MIVQHGRMGRGRMRIVGMAALVALLHAAGWGLLLVVVVPHDYDLGAGGTFGVGLGVTAYLLGARHAFDADHIAAIDNTTRKLVGENKPARSVGLWFALGHSSVVFVLCVLVGLGIRGLAGQVEDDSSRLQQATGLIGTLVSGVFLILIGLLNLGALVGITRLFRRMRTSELDEQELETQLNSRGLLARILGRVMLAVTKPWHMYPVGLLFGLGFRHRHRGLAARARPAAPRRMPCPGTPSSRCRSCSRRAWACSTPPTGCSCRPPTAGPSSSRCAKSSTT